MKTFSFPAVPVQPGDAYLSQLTEQGVRVRFGANGILLNYVAQTEFEGAFPSMEAHAGPFQIAVLTPRELMLTQAAPLWLVSKRAKEHNLTVELCKWHTGPRVLLAQNPEFVAQLARDSVTFVSRPVMGGKERVKMMDIFNAYSDTAGLSLGCAEGDPNALVAPDRHIAFLLDRRLNLLDRRLK